MKRRAEQPKGAAVLTHGKIVHEGAPAIELKVSVDREQQKNESFKLRHTNRLFILVLFAVLLVSLVLVFALGTNAYRALEDSRLESEQLRAQSSLLSATLRAADVAGAAAQEQGPEGPVLVMREGADENAYVIRLYHYQGNLVQEYAAAGTKLDPERATALCATEAFAFQIEDGLVRITTDAGQTLVALRSGGGDGQ